jgi:hypothetical protein
MNESKSEVKKHYSEVDSDIEVRPVSQASESEPSKRSSVGSCGNTLQGQTAVEIRANMERTEKMLNDWKRGYWKEHWLEEVLKWVGAIIALAVGTAVVGVLFVVLSLPLAIFLVAIFGFLIFGPLLRKIGAWFK